MKIKLIPVIISVGILLTSCGTMQNVTIAKRHYRNGFYVNMPSGVLPVSSEPEKEQTKPLTEKRNLISIINEPEPVAKHKTEKIFIAPALLFPFKNTIHVAVEKSFSPKHKKGNLQLVTSQQEAGYIIWTLIGILILVWLIALLTGGWGLGDLVYLILVLAIVLLVLRILKVIIY